MRPSSTDLTNTHCLDMDAMGHGHTLPSPLTPLRYRIQGPGNQPSLRMLHPGSMAILRQSTLATAGDNKGGPSVRYHSRWLVGAIVAAVAASTISGANAATKPTKKPAKATKAKV